MNNVNIFLKIDSDKAAQIVRQLPKSTEMHHDSLWSLGFRDDEQRDSIIDAAGKLGCSPVDLANFCIYNKDSIFHMDHFFIRFWYAVRDYWESWQGNRS
jgi:hypothetical protein